MKEIYFQCPYCLQAISIFLECKSFGFQTKIDTCKFCKKPIEVSYIIENNEIKTYSYNSIDER